jgi:DNA-binding NtrC family response regulator
VHLPALRDRLDDLPLLTEAFVTAFRRPDFQLSPAMLQRFSSYAWPGNVRELRNLVERALAGVEVPPLPESARPSPGGGAEALVDLPFKEAKERLVEGFVREYVEALLKRCNGNISEVARVAGLQRTYIHRLVTKYQLKSGG